MNLNTKYDVFISYSRKDYVDEYNNPINGNAISELLEFLDNNGISYWLDKNGIYSGGEFIEKITTAIEDSKLMIFVSSIHSNDSKWVKREIHLADDLDKYIVPFKIDDCQYNTSIRLIVGPLEFINYYSNPTIAFESLLKSITACKLDYEMFVQKQNERHDEETSIGFYEKMLKYSPQINKGRERYATANRLWMDDRFDNDGYDNMRLAALAASKDAVLLGCDEAKWLYNDILKDYPELKEKHDLTYKYFNHRTLKEKEEAKSEFKRIK